MRRTGWLWALLVLMASTGFLSAQPGPWPAATWVKSWALASTNALTARAGMGFDTTNTSVLTVTDTNLVYVTNVFVVTNLTYATNVFLVTNLTYVTNVFSYTNASGDGSGLTNLNASKIAPGTASINITGNAASLSGLITTITTDASATPSTVQITLSGTQNAVRIWTGEQSPSEAYFTLYASINGSPAVPIRLYRWQGRIINAAANATISLGTDNGRTLQVSAMTVPATLESISGVTNFANCDSGGPPCWTPNRPHLVLPSANSAFTIYTNKLDRPLFISEFDGEKWSPLRWVIAETNGSISVRCTYREIALANYDGAPLKVVAPTGSTVGGVSTRMSLVSSGPNPKYYCSTVPDLQWAISNAVAGDTIALADGTYALTNNITSANFASNVAAGFVGMEGITIRSASGNREACILSGALTNVGTWNLDSSLDTYYAAFKDLSWDYSNSWRGVYLNGGHWRMENCNFYGPQSPGAAEQYALLMVDTTLSPIWCDVLYCNAKWTYSDVYEISGKGTASTTTNSRVRLICCRGVEPGLSSPQCVSSHSGITVELYGGYYSTGTNAGAACFASGDDTAPLRCFFLSAPTPAVGPWQIQNVSMFGCAIGNHGNAIVPLNNASGYMLFNRLGTFLSAGSSHNRIFSLNLGFDAATLSSVVEGNIFAVTGGAIGARNHYTGAAHTNAVLNCTFINMTTAIDAQDTYSTLWLTNSAAKGNTTSIAANTSQTNGLLFADFNTLDPAVDGHYLPRANDITGGDAALDSRLFPVAGGNCDTNGAPSSFVGDSDPFGYVLIYGTNRVPRGARARPAILPGAVIHPDLF